MSNGPFTNPETDAEELGLDMVLPGPRELFLDIDTEEDYDHLHVMLGVLASNNVHFRQVRETRSKNGNRHVVLEVATEHPLTPVQRIAYQAALGSDRKRELLSLLRIDLGTGFPPTVFFEVREEVKAA